MKPDFRIEYWTNSKKPVNKTPKKQWGINSVEGTLLMQSEIDPKRANAERKTDCADKPYAPIAKRKRQITSGQFDEG
jgi:hypothetical protein